MVKVHVRKLLQRNKNQPPMAKNSHRFTKVTTLKCQNFITTGSDCPFVTQINPFVKELTDSWELLIKKAVNVIIQKMNCQRQPS